MVKTQRFPLLITATLQFTVRLGMGLLLQFRLREIGASLFTVGFLSSIRGSISTFMSPLWGSASDRRGKRKAIILLSTIGCSMSIPFYLVAIHPWQILLITTVVAFFSSGFDPVAMALSTEYSSKNSSYTRELSLLNFSNSLGMFFSRAFVGLLLLYLSVKSTMGIFAVLAFFSILSAFFIKDAVRSKENTVSEKVISGLFKKTGHIMRRNGLWALYISSFLRQFGISGILSLAAIYLTEQLKFSKSAVGFIAAINPIFQIPSHFFFAKIIEITRSKVVAVLGMSLSAGVAFLFLIGRTAFEIGMAYALLGIAFGAFINGTSVFITEITNSEERAHALGLLNSFRQTGSMMGPAVAGILATISYDLLFTVMIVIILVGSLLTQIITKPKE